MLAATVEKLIKGMVEIQQKRITAVMEDKLRSEQWDRLVWKAVFGTEEEKASSRWLIGSVAEYVGIKPASINDFYMARAERKIGVDFTVPAMNLRGMAYDMARAVFKTAKKLKVGALICELARSEMGYTAQPPAEYATVVLAGAVRAGFRGPVFIQGDHFQAKAVGPGEPKAGEIAAIKQLTQAAIEAGFYNIDIDMSTLVDLGRASEEEQQQPNIKYSLELVQFIREIEPPGITVSLGGEIGHIGGRNSTVADFRAYMDGFNAGLSKGMTGLSKISIATGTHHGGVVLPDGSLADVPVDFQVLAEISKLGRKEYHIGGAVQHGASTLPDQYFKEFVKTQTIEVHLATGFQNIMMDHPKFPKNLLERMYQWLDKEKTDERKEGQTDEQFYYKLRKKAWGQFKKECWQIEAGAREEIRAALEERFEFLFKELKVVNTAAIVEKII